MDLVVTYGGEASHVTNHGMIEGKRYSTIERLRCVAQIPAISKGKSISELSLVKMEAMFVKREP